MHVFLANRFVPAQSRPKPTGRKNKGGGEVAAGERVFENGAEYRGEFVNGRIEGEGALRLPEGTVIRGRFEDNRFVEGVALYFGEVRVDCRVRQTPKSDDVFLESFRFCLPSGHCVVGTCKGTGNVHRADVLDPRGALRGRFTGARVTLPVPQRPGHVLIVTRTWVYEGLVQDHAESQAKHPDSIEFGAEGVQLWTKGFGYLRLLPRADLVAKQLLRAHRRLFLFREVVWAGHRAVCSASAYADGLFFLSGADLCVGVLAGMRPDGRIATVPCALRDAISLDGHVAVGSRRVLCRANHVGKTEFSDHGRLQSFWSITTSQNKSL